MNLNFHQTFKPEKKYITEVLLLAQKEEEHTKDEISFITGIPTGKSSGKVLPHLDYAQFMGLITYNVKNGKYFVKLTDLGKIVVEEDISLFENITLLLLHAMLIRDSKGADLWNFCFFKYVNKYGKVSNYSTLKKELSNYFMKNVNISPLKGSYTDFFAELNLLNIDEKNDRVEFNDINYDFQFDYLYAYILFEYWDIKYPNQNEISATEIEGMSLQNIYGWSKSQFQEVLQVMADKGFIRLNRQLSPFTVLRLVDKDSLLTQIYSELY